MQFLSGHLPSLSKAILWIGQNRGISSGKSSGKTCGGGGLSLGFLAITPPAVHLDVQMMPW